MNRPLLRPEQRGRASHADEHPSAQILGIGRHLIAAACRSLTASKDAGKVQVRRGIHPLECVPVPPAHRPNKGGGGTSYAMGQGGRKLRNVRPQSAIRAFNRIGYRTVRVRGSHHVLKHPNRSMIVLPMHRGTVKIGILLDAIERAGVSPEEFEALL